MSRQAGSAKLCDRRLLQFDTKDFVQKNIDYKGVRITSRQFPSLSSPENIVTDSVYNQQMFLMGGYDLNFKMLYDKGYYMYDIESNTMNHVTSYNEDELDIFMRISQTLNTIRVPITNKSTADYCAQFGVKVYGFQHYLFGGLVGNTKSVE